MTYLNRPEDTFAPPPEFTSHDIVSLRRTLNLSQPYFAALVGAKEVTVRAWELGVRKVGRPTARLLQIIREEHGTVDRIAQGFKGDA